MTCTNQCLHCKNVRELLTQVISDGTLDKIAYHYSPHNADDLVQATAIHMLEKAHSYKEGNFVGFLRTMMFRLFLNQKRSQGRALAAREILAEKTRTNLSELQGLNQMERRILIKECYTHLNPNERKILLLLKDGYVHREIADMLDINLNTVHGQVSRIKTKLCKLVSQL